jgi:hypothetical protein
MIRERVSMLRYTYIAPLVFKGLQTEVLVGPILIFYSQVFIFKNTVKCIKNQATSSKTSFPRQIVSKITHITRELRMFLPSHALSPVGP